MSRSALAQAKAEIEKLKAELRDAQSRIQQIIRQNVEASNQRENKLLEIERENKRLKEKIRRLKKKKK